MPQVLTTSSKIVCPHGGIGTTTPSQPSWKVDGGFVCVDGDQGVLSCKFVTPCVGYTLRSMGLNATRINGKRVMLVTDFNQSITGLPLSMSATHATHDNSTTAPLPATGPVPPLPPALQDTAPPVVQGSLSSSAFSVMASSPASITATFQLTGAFPGKWVLTRIGKPAPGTHEDLTSGNPAGVSVTPSGGGWGASPLTVTMTLTAAYMAALAQGVHQFYMTGVSQRGLSQNTKVELTVGP
jgi:hypothetical protein